MRRTVGIERRIVCNTVPYRRTDDAPRARGLLDGSPYSRAKHRHATEHITIIITCSYLTTSPISADFKKKASSEAHYLFKSNTAGSHADISSHPGRTLCRALRIALCCVVVFRHTRPSAIGRRQVPSAAAATHEAPGILCRRLQFPVPGELLHQGQD